MHLEPLQGALEAYCRRNLHDPNSVADVLQSVVANAYRDFDLYTAGTNFRAWIFHYLHLELLGRNRRDARTRHAPLPMQLASPEASDAALRERDFEILKECPESVLDHCDETLAAAVRDLPPPERAVFLLRALGEFKYREIAEILEIPLGTVMSHLSRGRARLRERLADSCRQQSSPSSREPPARLQLPREQR